MIDLILLAALAAAVPGPVRAAESAQAAAPVAVPAPAVVAASRGAQLMSEQRYPEAIPVLERELRADPGSPTILLNLGWAYWHARRIDDAWKIAATLVKLDPGNRAFLIFMANTSIEKGDYNRAISLMNRALKLFAQDHDASLVLARALFRAGREKEALKVVDGVLARRPDDAAAAYRRAVFLSDLGRKKEALDALEALLAREPENASYRRSRARILSDIGRQAEAKSEWGNLTRGQTDAQSLMNLGWTYWRERNLDAAWEIAVTLVKLDDENPAFLRFMANLELERQNYDNALELARKTVKLAPKDQDASLTLAKALFQLHRAKEAMAILRDLIVRFPDSRSVQYRWAELLAGTRRYNEALYYFDRLVKADPENETYRMNRATVLYEMGRFDDAVGVWESRGAREVPDVNSLRRLRDDAVNRQGWDDAVEWQRKLIAASPRDPAGWETLSRIYTEMKLPSKALWAAERAIVVDPVSINAYYMRAEILEAIGDWAAATAAYEEITRRNPNSVRAIDGLSYTLEANGDFDGSLKQIARIEALIAPTVSPYLELHRARVLADSGRLSQARPILDRLAKDERTVIPALLYHGISPTHRTDSIPVETFRAQMRALKKKGYQSITASELALAMQGKAALPPKPILITFDDGRADSFDNADPVLRETGYRATMFVHVSRLRKPYFHAGAEDIARWASTGRWEIQAHGSQAHDPMILDAFGRRGHFLPNRKWLGEEGRLETLSEYQDRVARDFEEAKAGVEAIVPGRRVVAFAFPFGDYGQNDYSNTPESAAINRALVKKNFRLAFVQAQQGMNTLSSNPTDLKRFSVPRYMTAEALTGHLALGDPRVQAKLVQAQLWVRAEQLGRANAVFAELEAQGVTEPRILAEKAASYQRGGDISYARNLFSEAAALEPDKEGPGGERTRTQLLQAEHAAAPAATAEVQHLTDSDRNELSKAILRGGGVVKAVRLEGWVGQGEYIERRDPALPTPLIVGREGGAALRWFALPELELGGFYARREFSRGATGSADNYSLAAGWQAVPALKLTVRDGLSNVETAAGIRNSRRFHTNGGGAVWDPALNWRVNADYDQNRYNDSNLQQDVRVRLTRIFSERASVGFAYFHGEAKSSRPEYYTPRRLNQYSGVVTLRETFGAINPRTGRARADALLLYEGGYGLQPEGSRRVHSVRAGFGISLIDSVAVRLGGQYSESPTYISRRAEGSLAVSF
ncbi:MAG: tetratricopeptide repeat protein [Elusimicrobia bacterium]|nr:tetratricopeptide repeat protein [Elusimicrobiota bacterium]